MANERPDPKRIDEATGTNFVGHEWDGIEELDTPMPRWWLWTFYLTIVWALVYVVLYPAWPLIEKGTEGVLGWTSRGQLAQEMTAADQSRASVREQIAAIDIEELRGNPDLMRQAVAGGAAAFKVNCIQCHGSGAAGSQTLGYPNLNDDDWLWGGDLTAIQATLTHGIRQQGDDATRTSEMPPFDGVFSQGEMNALVDHVLSLSGKAKSSPVGAKIYADNCVICHGASGEGDRSVGGPKLADAIWLYGSTRADIARQIRSPRMGVMPK
ncbi:MAG: cytochrome-c oxidase, cbb3-type subunit III, partial [Altererythrobacter sp.]